eukprot:6469386-Amphidinium_carterae.4
MPPDPQPLDRAYIALHSANVHGNVKERATLKVHFPARVSAACRELEHKECHKGWRGALGEELWQDEFPNIADAMDDDVEERKGPRRWSLLSGWNLWSPLQTAGTVFLSLSLWETLHRRLGQIGQVHRQMTHIFSLPKA